MLKIKRKKKKQEKSLEKKWGKKKKKKKKRSGTCGGCREPRKISLLNVKWFLVKKCCRGGDQKQKTTKTKQTKNTQKEKKRGGHEG